MNSCCLDDKIFKRILIAIDSTFLRKLKLKDNKQIYGHKLYIDENKNLQYLNLSNTEFLFNYLRDIFLCKFGSNLKKLIMLNC